MKKPSPREVLRIRGAVRGKDAVSNLTSDFSLSISSSLLLFPSPSRVPPGSGGSAYRSTDRPVRTAHTRR
ncbi:hypothetical protein BHE74_00018469 [Ensete ventricosum]|nr:hypothetical protein GW17_00007200 [Ensete ventricosum]RWW73646.1 hypothetical protein BHE74_00018469 [Ensete ventricosum]RZR88979.1 hypothetical protein BHM03_00016639 [Ensete ventricosum]